MVAINYPTNHFRGLPAILAERGYTTISACAAREDFWNMNQMHPRLGFQRSFFEGKYNISEHVGFWLADREFFNQTIPILQAQTQPFMAYLLSASNHFPYQLSNKYRVLKLGELEGTLLGDYLHSVHYFDQAFGEFVDQLRGVGLLDKSVVVVYGDHQAFLGAPPELARLLSFPQGSDYHYFQVRKRVPLLIRLPGGEGAGVMSVTGGHLDIAPTLLSLLGISDDDVVMLGRDLTRGENSLVVFRDGSFADGTHYYINRFGPATLSACYEVGTGRALNCGLLEERRREALERLEMSDLIIRGDLIRALGARQNFSLAR
jgi:phosphoglycerol transferase MdoB-like AlkP superfamily enzyme